MGLPRLGPTRASLEPAIFWYAQESSWREGNCHTTNSEQTRTVVALAMKHGARVDFGGYWQRHIKVA
jgi:hypothetical protein